MRNRSDRTNDFDEFYNNSKDVFEKLRDGDSRAKNFEKQYMLSVCPGSRAGGQEKRLIEVFWGSRPYEVQTHHRGWKSLIEEGATLSIYRNDTGHVTITLYPAKTDYRRPFEDSITIYRGIDPIKLKNHKFINSLWVDFMAYMELTSLDGNPDWYQKKRIWYLRNFKNLVVDKTWKPTNFSDFSKDILKFVLTVGLSGFVFFIVSVLTEPKEKETNLHLIELNNQTKIQTEQLNKILTEQSQLLVELAKIHSLNTELLNSNQSQKDSINIKIVHVNECIDKINMRINKIIAERTTDAKNP